MAATDLLSEILEDAAGSDWDAVVLGEANPATSPPLFHEDVAPAEATVPHLVSPVPLSIQLSSGKSLWRRKSGRRRRLRAWKPRNAPPRKVQKKAVVPQAAACSTQKSAYCVSSSEDECVVLDADHHASGSCVAGSCGVGTGMASM